MHPFLCLKKFRFVVVSKKKIDFGLEKRSDLFLLCKKDVFFFFLRENLDLFLLMRKFSFVETQKNQVCF